MLFISKQSNEFQETALLSIQGNDYFDSEHVQFLLAEVILVILTMYNLSMQTVCSESPLMLQLLV